MWMFIIGVTLSSPNKPLFTHKIGAPLLHVDVSEII